LLREGFITPIDSFGYLSPHPTVYRTLKVGTLIVSRHRYAFTDRENLIFEPWLVRYSDPGLNGPLRIGQLYHVSGPSLCCDKFPNICIHCDNTRAIMRQILNYRSKKLAGSYVQHFARAEIGENRRFAREATAPIIGEMPEIV
jgi:hypothetical protein